MYLKTLELIGFKSFAEKTRLEFPTGVTAIVGPNGCGKSNILDALRWVLGEQSAKALRGSEMADVIFSGSDQRKQVGMAEVSLTFADCEKELGTDYHEITISRRVFRDGHSEYELNKSLCRLRDIQQLFMDTGIGRSAYSIMEQGKIDKILSARPEDRREIFEEAAGITKYKTQKKEALRKLENTEANLIRLNDIFSEVKRQINSLQRQAGKARRYKELYDQLKTLETQLGYHHSLELQQQIQKIQTQISDIAIEIEKSTLENTQLEKAWQENRQKGNDLEKQVDYLRQDQMESHSARDRAQNRLHLNAERLNELDQQDRQAHLDSAGAEERVKIQTEQLTQLAAQIDSLQDQLSQHQLTLQNNQYKAGEAQKTLQTHLQTLLQFEMQLSAKEKELYPINQQLSHRDAEQRTTLLRVETIKNEIQTTQKLLINFSEQRTSLETQIQTLSHQLHSSQQQLCAQQQQQQEITSHLVKLQQKKQSVERVQLEHKLQHSIIEKLQASYQEFNPAVQQIFQAYQKGELANLSKIITLAETFTILPGNELAIEALLQYQLETIIVSETAEALQIVNFLKPHESDRIKLAPLNFTRPSEPQSDRPEAAIRHLTIIEPYQPLLGSLLTESYIVDNLQDAFSLKQQIPFATIATRQGELISNAGIIQAGPLQQRFSNLNRKEEIHHLQNEISLLDTQLETLNQETSALTEKEQSFIPLIENTERNIQSFRSQNTLLERDLHLCLHQIEASEQKLHLSENEINQITKIEQSAAEKYQIQLEQRTLLEKEKASLQEKLKMSREKLPSLQEEEVKFSQELTENRVIIAGYEEKLKGFLHQSETNAQRLKELEQNLEAYCDLIRSNQEKRLQLHQENETLKKEIVQLQVQLDEKEKNLHVIQNTRNELQQILEQQQITLQQKQKQQTHWQQQRAQAEVQLAKYQLEIQNLKERLLQTYQVNLENDATLEALSQPQDWDQIQQQSRELREKLEAMGPVNLEAVSEYDELEKRLHFLEDQQKDLLQSKQNLLDAIAFVNRTTKKLFVETFEQIRQNFQSTFTELFGGGKANLLLSEEQDPLECGIEIVAKPPGKQPQSVALLSGGERTMTAVALLFAIYMVKPSPFCVLDEMDAPLDESNIDRFLKILQRFLHQSQFLLITHNKKTISMADTLYGVTMEENGISKLVSVKLNKTESRVISSVSQPELTPKVETVDEINSEKTSLETQVSIAA